MSFALPLSKVTEKSPPRTNITVFRNNLNQAEIKNSKIEKDIYKRTSTRASVKMQTRLTINKSGDDHEADADRIAEQIMCITDPSSSIAQNGILECKVSADKDDVLIYQRSAQHRDKDEAVKYEPLPPEFTVNLPVSKVPPIARALRSSGKRLDPLTRAFMESRFGYDFSQIRVHIDEKAAESARSMNALAYTVGHDIVFGKEQYTPGTIAGKKLLAHELVHVLQQSQLRTKPNALKLQRKVSRCCRSVQTGRSLMDIAASLLGLKHCWLKTDAKIAGMGPAQEGPLPAWPFGIDTKITDHSGEITESCIEIHDIDESCVNQELQIGKSTGKWGVGNNCNTFVENIINVCRSSIKSKIQTINNLFDGWVSDNDIKIIKRLYQNTPTVQQPEVKKAIEARIPDLTDIGQRTQVRIILLEKR